ncbi:MAG: hypothetical protein ACRECQ_16665 [Burkholderiaceae bacterium]
MLRSLIAACLVIAPLFVAAATIYKVQMPDGSVLFSDSVPAGGKVLEERESKNTPRVSTVPSPPPTVKGGAIQPVPRTGPAGIPPGSTVRPLDPNSKLKMPAPDVSTSERELAVARRKLELGREPLPGERRGLAGGGSRLTPEYESRIASMEREVAAAEAKLKQAYDARRN